MHPMTHAVAREAEALEFRQFQVPEDREQINEIRALALEQVADDRPSMTGPRRDRVGDVNPARNGVGWVTHANPDDGAALWKRWTPEQMALEESFVPLLQGLSPQQRETVHLLYWGRLTYRQAAAVLKITVAPLQGLERRALTRLHRAITARYLEVEEAA